MTINFEFWSFNFELGEVKQKIQSILVTSKRLWDTEYRSNISYYLQVAGQTECYPTKACTVIKLTKVDPVSASYECIAVALLLSPFLVVYLVLIMASTEPKKSLFRGCFRWVLLGSYWSEYATTTHFHEGKQITVPSKIKKVLQNN